LVLGRQRGVQSGPLTGDPRTDRSDRKNDGHDQNSQQDGVFDERGTILVLAQLANEIEPRSEPVLHTAFEYLRSKFQQPLYIDR